MNKGVDKSFPESFCFFFSSGLYVREIVLKEQVINLYENLKIFLSSDDFGEDLRNELEKSNPNYLEVLEKRIKDMEKCDHGIVIAGNVLGSNETFLT